MFKMEFKTSNAAFCNPFTGEEDKEKELEESSNIVYNISMKMLKGETSGTIMDYNGNAIGKWSLE